ncbi:hypothetical protein ACTMSW_22000 [Micromonospora sp. BQ11]|uniref:hypothetical protein n=1 Tax=Micromonospora sp. BQ11 TaxID=3452212 RepID=UPI003F8911EE
MKLRAALAVALTALGLSVVLVVPPAGPAWACSCVPLNPTELDEHADRIVVGTVTQVTDNGVQLAVDTVEKGSSGPGETLRLRVSRSEASCGYDFRVGIRYRVNSNGGATGLCAGIREFPATPSATPAIPTSAAAASAREQMSSRWWFAAGAAGAMLAVFAAGVAAVALRRRRHGQPAGGTDPSRPPS